MQKLVVEFPHKIQHIGGGGRKGKEVEFWEGWDPKGCGRKRQPDQPEERPESSSREPVVAQC